MSDDIVHVEALDRKRRPVLVPGSRPTMSSMNAMMFLFALLASLGILIVALGTVLEERE
jgi:hypothetical protein